MEPNFEALSLIAEVALGIVGFSAVLIGLSRSADGFSEADDFRIQLLSFSGFGALFAALLPFSYRKLPSHVEPTSLGLNAFCSTDAATG